MWPYTEQMFEKDKEELLEWLEKEWTYKSWFMTYLGNILKELKIMINNSKEK